LQQIYKWLSIKNPVQDINNFPDYFFDDRKVVWIDNMNSKFHTPVKIEVFESELIKAIFGRIS